MTEEKIATSNSDLGHYNIDSFTLDSEYLDRSVKLDVYLPKNVENLAEISLLVINDGQDMETLGLAPMLDILIAEDAITPILAVGIHCNEYRKLEYGTADILDYQMLGSRARYHRKFILKELIPYVLTTYNLTTFKEVAFAGFSLGGLSAMDIAWKHPEVFSKVGIFSGSFWWRSKALHQGYNEETDRIMHQLIREGEYHEGQKFFFEAGALDETMDRNNNGIIDSIDDTMGIIEELEKKGYDHNSIFYLELEDGHHDVPTWGRAMPTFLKWGWGKKT
jgi:enterochelin esterase family protein